MMQSNYLKKIQVLEEENRKLYDANKKQAINMDWELKLREKEIQLDTER